MFPCTLHSACEPHGDGMHGLVGGAGGRAAEYKIENIYCSINYELELGKIRQKIQPSRFSATRFGDFYKKIFFRRYVNHSPSLYIISISILSK